MPFGPYSSMTDCIGKNQSKNNPGAYCAQIHHDITGKWPSEEAVSRSYDFQRIHDEFIKYYCKDAPLCDLGESEYYQWITDMKADESKDYAYCLESFQFARDKLNFYREDADNKYYKVLVGFPITSMNGNVYAEQELQRAAKGLIGIPANLNHKSDYRLEGVTFTDANYEDGAAEAIMKVPKTLGCPICDPDKQLYELIDAKRIVNVSLEATCANNPMAGEPCRGLKFVEYALLTTDVLPGIPMARIFPLEHIMKEAFHKPRPSHNGVTRGLKVKVKLKEQAMTDEHPDAKTPDEQGNCPPGYTLKDGLCVPEESTTNPPEIPEGTEVAVGSQVPDTSKKPVTEIADADLELERSEAIVRAHKAESERDLMRKQLEAVKQTGDEKIAKLENEVAQRTKEVAELKGELKAVRTERDKHEQRSSLRDTEAIEKDRAISQLQRRLQEVTESRDDYKRQAEAEKQEREETTAKYKDVLERNLQLTRKLTEFNEQYVEISKERDELDQRVKKKTRLGKLIVKA